MSLSQLTAEQRAEVEMDLASLAEEFDELGFDLAEADSKTTDAFAELDAELAGTELAPMSAAAPMSFGAMGLGDDGEVDAFFFSWIKNKAKKLIQKLVKLVKRYGDCVQCVSKVTRAVALFKAKKYPAAIKAAYDAYRCIQKCAKD